MLHSKKLMSIKMLTLHPARMFTESLTPRPELENSQDPKPTPCSIDTLRSQPYASSAAGLDTELAMLDEVGVGGILYNAHVDPQRAGSST